MPLACPTLVTVNVAIYMDLVGRCDIHGNVCTFASNPHRQLGPALKVVSTSVLSVFDLLPLLLAHLFTRSMLLAVGLSSNAG